MVRSLVIALGALAVGVAVATIAFASGGGPPEKIALAQVPACDGFDFPVGAPDGDGYYDAQAFGANDHLGNDWNGLGGNDTDFGDPVYAVAGGVVVEATDHGGGWGNVIRIVHDCDGERVESLYAHLAAIAVAPGDGVPRGQIIGSIGDAGGRYRAHLHFELRDRVRPLGGGYGRDRAGYLDPTAYIRAHRPR